MSTRKLKRWWRITRLFLRGIPVCVLLVIFLFVGLLAWVNTVGLPDFLKVRLITELHAHGLDLEFSRLRWRWNRGLVADNVIIGSAKQETSVPQLSSERLEIKLNHRALGRLKIHVDSVTLIDGRLLWPLDEPNKPAASLSVTNIQTQLRLLPGNQWALDHFTAGFAGGHLRLSGVLTNASALRDWKALHGQAKTQPTLLRQRLRELSDAIDHIHFANPPELNLILNGDAKDPRAFNGVLTLDAQDATTPWGELTNGSLCVQLIPPTGTNTLPKVTCQLSADAVKFAVQLAPTRELAGDTKQFKLNLDAVADEQTTNLVRANMDITSGGFNTPWAQATNAHLTAHWTHSLTNPVPIAGTGGLSLTDANTPWGSVGLLELSASLRTPETNGPPQADASWAWWGRLEPYVLDWSSHIENIHVGDFVSKEVVCGGSWRAPELTITNLHTEMYQGRFDANADVNVATRLAHFACASDFDVQKAYPLLTKGAREWLNNQDFGWEKPPLLSGSGSVILPSWTNSHPDWHHEVLPTFSLSGEFTAGAASYRKIPVTSAHGHIYYTNETSNLPDLVANRPEGKVELALVSDDRTQNYYFRFRSTADVKAVHHLLPPKAQHALDEFAFTQPPLIDAEIWGRWHNHERIGFKGQVTATNFTFKGETATYFHTFFDYTNLFLGLKNARLERTNEYLSASSLLLDINGKRGFLTNGFSTMEPMVFLRAIGPKVAKDMEPYHFMKPPVVHADGVIPLGNDTQVANLHFKVEGGPFEWLKFNAPHIAGTVDWAGQVLTLQDINATFYEGKLTGSAGFDFTRDEGTIFHFDTIVTGANLHSMMSDLTTSTNHLEGTLNGHLTITQADSNDPHSWFGKGQLDLHDGLIWDIPIFGILTPVLDAISPGLGKTRASDAAGSFIITNSIILSDDLVIRSPTIRLFYRGAINFDRHVDATVDAEVGRDTPVVGPVVGTLSAPFGKLFETRITGNLENPKREPVLFLVRWLDPFHWLHTLKDALTPSSSSSDSPPPQSHNLPPK